MYRGDPTVDIHSKNSLGCGETCYMCCTCCFCCFGCCGLCCPSWGQDASDRIETIVRTENETNFTNVSFFVVYSKTLPFSQHEATIYSQGFHHLTEIETKTHPSPGSKGSLIFAYAFEDFEDFINTEKDPLLHRVRNSFFEGSIIVWLSCHDEQAKYFLHTSQTILSDHVKLIVINTCYPNSTHEVLIVPKPCITYKAVDEPVSDKEAFVGSFLLFRALVIYDSQTRKQLNSHQKLVFTRLLEKLEEVKQQNLQHLPERSPASKFSEPSSKKKKLPLLNTTIEIFYGGLNPKNTKEWTVKELKELLLKSKIDISTCYEKTELFDLAIKNCLINKKIEETEKLILKTSEKDFPTLLDKMYDYSLDEQDQNFPAFQVSKRGDKVVSLSTSKELLVLLENVYDGDYKIEVEKGMVWNARQFFVGNKVFNDLISK